MKYVGIQITGVNGYLSKTQRKKHENGFAGINYNILWDILMHYGIPWKINNINIHYYTKTSPIKLHRGTMTDYYPVTTGVRKDAFFFLLSS